jgi:hypothetical protein
MSGIFIYQILNHYTKAEDLDPGFAVLDNSSNERPDWFEYWPIRKFLLAEPLDEEAFYGFLSPKFKRKTNLSAAAAREFVRRHSDTIDVALLSQSIHLPAYHLNIFKFGDAAHPGLLRVATQFFKRIGEPTDLNEFVTTSRNEVYSNYLIAKPRFWRAWLNITEQLFAFAELPADPLGAELLKATSYRDRHDVQMKIFIMERIATWILARDSRFVARARDPFVARSRTYKLPGAILCDALKIAYVTNGRRAEYKELFYSISRLGRFLGWQIRLGSFFGFKHMRACVAALSSHWARTGES